MMGIMVSVSEGCVSFCVSTITDFFGTYREILHELCEHHIVDRHGSSVVVVDMRDVQTGEGKLCSGCNVCVVASSIGNIA